MRAMRALVTAMIAVLVGVDSAVAMSSGWRLVAADKTYAIYATLTVAGTAPHPTAMGVQIVAVPPQATSVAWRLVCLKGGRTRSTTGSYTARSTVIRSLRLPVADPASCRASVHGKLTSGGGTLTVRIYSRR
jgi:hypothetical protein